MNVDFISKKEHKYFEIEKIKLKYLRKRSISVGIKHHQKNNNPFRPSVKLKLYIYIYRLTHLQGNTYRFFAKDDKR